MTIAQIKAMRNRMANDFRYGNRKDPESSKKRDAEKRRREQERQERGKKKKN